MPTFLKGPSFGQPLLRSGLVMAVYSFGYLVCRVALVAVPEDWGRARLLVLPGLLGGGLFLAGILSRQVLLTAAGYVVGGLCWSAEYPAIMATAARRTRTQFGQNHGGLCDRLASARLGHGLGGRLERTASRRSVLWQPMALLACGYVAVGAGGGLWLLLWGRGATSRR